MLTNELWFITFLEFLWPKQKNLSQFIPRPIRFIIFFFLLQMFTLILFQINAKQIHLLLLGKKCNLNGT